MSHTPYRDRRFWRNACCAVQCFVALLLVSLIIASTSQAAVISSYERLDSGGVAPGFRDGSTMTFQSLTPLWRDYTFFTLESPSYMRSADVLLPQFMADSIDPDFQLKITLSKPASVFVMVDDQLGDISAKLPWLASMGFVDTGDNLFVHGPFGQQQFPMSIYRAEFPAGPLVLQAQNSGNFATAMYTVAAIPEPTSLALLLVAGASAVALPLLSPRNEMGRQGDRKKP